MSDELPIIDFPKLRSPFIRVQGILTPEIDPDQAWVFGPDTEAVDKLDGTNLCVHIDRGAILYVDNRTTRYYDLLCSKPTKWTRACVEGLQEAGLRGWLPRTGSVRGELIGPIFNGNRHRVEKHLFVPFAWLREHCSWRSWSTNKYPKTFESISEWFRDGLCSLFETRLGRKPEETRPEGVVFYGPEGQMAKLRVDMFPWQRGRH